MAMRTGGISGGTHSGDYIALVYILSNLYIKVAVMRIKGLDAAAVVYNYIVAISGFAPFCFNDCAGGGSINIASIAAACNIHTGVIGITPYAAAYISADGRPDKAA